MVFSACVATISWLGIASEAFVAAERASILGLSGVKAAFIFLRFFTNLTSIGVASLLTVTFWRTARRERLPSADLYGAVLVYILVVSGTYEIVLRRLWTPQGITFVRDAVMHDVVPTLTLLFWLALAPKAGLSLRRPALWLVYPSAYVVVVEAAGALGQGYPYYFLDPGAIGYGGLTITILAFSGVFYGLGVLVVVLSRALTRVALAREDLE